MEHHAYFVETMFYLNGKYVTFTYTPYYPIYTIGEELDLNTLPTLRERTRRPKQEMTRRSAKVVGIRKALTQSDHEHNLFLHKVTVMLEDID